MSGWQDIASAPRDGSEIVGWDEASGTKHVTWWDDGRWYDPDSHYYSQAPVFEPTLFCILPDAPTPPSTEGQGA